MRDEHRRLLREQLDGTLSAEDEPELARLLEESASARRYLAEHEAVWAALGDAWSESPLSSSAAFREATLEAARRPTSRRRSFVRRGLAAAALLTVGLILWERAGPAEHAALPEGQREVVRYLHVLRDFDLIETHAVELDLRADFEILRAFGGELEGEG